MLFKGFSRVLCKFWRYPRIKPFKSLFKIAHQKNVLVGFSAKGTVVTENFCMISKLDSPAEFFKKVSYTFLD